MRRERRGAAELGETAGDAHAPPAGGNAAPLREVPRYPLALREVNGPIPRCDGGPGGSYVVLEAPRWFSLPAADARLTGVARGWLWLGLFALIGSGLLSIVLRFVPYIGPAIAMILPLFLALRAAIRAKVLVSQAALDANQDNLLSEDEVDDFDDDGSDDLQLPGGA